MLADLKAAPDGAVVLLHSCAHNPTGVDPTAQQWKDVCSVLKARSGLQVIFDCAYQGFARCVTEPRRSSSAHDRARRRSKSRRQHTLPSRPSHTLLPLPVCLHSDITHDSGDAEADAFAVRHFVSEGVPLALTQSFAKNFGLYGERVGLVSLVCKDEAEAARTLSQLKILARPIYSSPPIHGARIVARVLSDPALEQQWRGECKAMADRIIAMRAALKEELNNSGSTLDWSHITRQVRPGRYGSNARTQPDGHHQHHILPHYASTQPDGHHQHHILPHCVMT